MLSIITAVTTFSALALTGTMAGIFSAFSLSVMLGLDAIAPDCAIAAMQSINRKIQNPVFFLVFGGAPLTTLLAGGLLLARGETGAGIAALIAATVYLLGALGPTIAVNVPLNEALDRATIPADPTEATRMWTDFSARWTRWNTGRALASTGGFLLIGLALAL